MRYDLTNPSDRSLLRHRIDKGCQIEPEVLHAALDLIEEQADDLAGWRDGSSDSYVEGEAAS